MPKILILHGINYYNAGDHGILLSMLLALKKNINNVKIKVASPFLANIKNDLNYISSVRNGFEHLYPDEIPDLYQLPVGKKRKLRVLFYGLRLIIITALFSCIPYYFRKKLSGITRFTSEVADADIILSKGGGFLLDVGTSYKIPTHLVTIWIAILFKKKVLIYAQTVGPFKSRIALDIAKFVLKKVTLILVRDEYSKAYCENSLKIPSEKLILSADSAFELNKDIDFKSPKIINEVDNEARPKTICISLVSPRFAGLQNKVFEENYCTMMSMTASTLAKQGYQIVFIPHLESGSYSDRILAKRILGQCEESSKTSISILPPLNPLEIIKKMESSYVCVCSRMHSMIFALDARVPFLALSYLPKSDSMLKEACLDSWRLSLVELSKERPHLASNKMINKLSNIIEKIEVNTALAAQANLHFFNRAQKNIMAVKQQVEDVT